MEAIEIRVGNKVNLNGADLTVKSIEWNGANQEYYVRVNEDFRVLKLSHLSPIPITEELLLKAGFVEQKAKKGVQKSWHLDGITIELSNSGNFYYCKEPITFNELQNVYYFYRNRKKELTFKQ